MSTVQGRIGEPSNPIALLGSLVSRALVQGRDPVGFPTPFGAASVVHGKIAGRHVVAIDRYGPNGSVASHKVNYRANIWALRALGAQRVISENAIASVDPRLHPGEMVVPDDFLDYTKTRALSMYDAFDVWVRTDMTTPFCPELRQAVLASARSRGCRVRYGGTFACVEGPRFETRAEVAALRAAGACIVGTPLVPELTLAREVGMCFCSLAPVVNFATGLGPAVDHVGMIHYYEESGLRDRALEVIGQAVAALSDTPACDCTLVPGAELFRGLYGSCLEMPSAAPFTGPDAS